MTKAANSGASLTVEHIQAFIDSADSPPPRKQLFAPNLEIAKAWSKQYPGYDILLSSEHLPKTTNQLNKENKI
jgi:hypothetical protein